MSKYISKDEILEWVQEVNPKVDDIPDRIMEKGHSLVDRTLVNKNVYDIPTTGDALGFLKNAASCWNYIRKQCYTKY